MEELETIKIELEDGTEEEFAVLEETQLMGRHYYLVAPVSQLEGEDDGECYVLREMMDESNEEFGVYEFVDDEDELNCVFPIFEELLEESDTEVEF